jgi:prolyl-tRNA editing enzyme YbaK/EbsC (Cys-tRNA(Pro) deacylase)
LRGSIEVHRYLTERGIPHEFYRLDRPLRRLDEEAADLLDLKPSQVVIARLFETAQVPVLALSSAAAKPTAAGVVKAMGDGHVRAATSSRVTEHTGFLAQWLPPVGHEQASRALLEASLAESDVLYAAGGDPGVMLVIRAADLIRATSATAANLVAPAPATPSLLAG